MSVTVAVPGPVTLAALSTCIHPRSDATVQAHAAAVVTVTDPVPPPAPNDNDEVDRVNVHAGGGVGSVGDFFSHAPAAPSASKTDANSRRYRRDMQT
jgi:hypothetical protein